MFEIKEIKVIPNREKFGIEHHIYLKGDIDRLKKLFERYASAQDFTAEGRRIEITFSPQEVVSFELRKPLEDYYDEDIHTAWKEMVASAMGIEEPFRYFSFYGENGEHIGTVGFKQDCESLIPIILLYRSF